MSNRQNPWSNYYTVKCCKDCVAPKRHPGCHDTCKEYNDEKQRQEARKQKRKDEREKMGRPMGKHDFDMLQPKSRKLKK